MFDAGAQILLNVLYLGALTATNVQLLSTKKVEPQELHVVSAVEFRPVTAFWSESFPCRYTGVAVTVERDWDEEVEFGGLKTIHPAEPGKIHTYGIIVNKKNCPGKEPEAMFSTSSWQGLFANIGVDEGVRLMVTSVSPDPARQPKWLPQALRVIEHVAPTNEVAKEFLAFNASAAAKKAPTEQSVPAASQEVSAKLDY